MKVNAIAKTQISWTRGPKRMTRRHRRILLKAQERDRGRLGVIALCHCYETQFSSSQAEFGQTRQRRHQSSRNRNSCRYSRSQSRRFQPNTHRFNRRQLSRFQPNRFDQLHSSSSSSSSSRSSKSLENAKLIPKSQQSARDFLQVSGPPLHQTHPIYQPKSYDGTRSHKPLIVTDVTAMCASNCARSNLKSDVKML